MLYLHPNFDIRALESLVTSEVVGIIVAKVEEVAIAQEGEGAAKIVVETRTEASIGNPEDVKVVVMVPKDAKT